MHANMFTPFLSFLSPPCHTTDTHTHKILCSPPSSPPWPLSLFYLSLSLSLFLFRLSLSSLLLCFFLALPPPRRGTLEAKRRASAQSHGTKRKKPGVRLQSPGCTRTPAGPTSGGRCRAHCRRRAPLQGRVAGGAHKVEEERGRGAAASTAAVRQGVRALGAVQAGGQQQLQEQENDKGASGPPGEDHGALVGGEEGPQQRQVVQQLRQGPPRGGGRAGELRGVESRHRQRLQGHRPQEQPLKGAHVGEGRGPCGMVHKTRGKKG